MLQTVRDASLIKSSVNGKILPDEWILLNLTMEAFRLTMIGNVNWTLHLLSCLLIPCSYVITG